MREIKFRAWTGNRMIDFKEVRDMRATPWNSTSLKWTQYTGLLDKNGKEIYEGDIISFRTYTSKQKPKVVEWVVGQQAGWNIGRPRNGGAISYVVLGNIFENKDLL